MEESAEPVASVGDYLVLKLPCNDGNVEKLRGTVVKVKASKKVKGGSAYVYSIDVGGERCVKTRLTDDIKWKRKKQQRCESSNGASIGDGSRSTEAVRTSSTSKTGSIGSAGFSIDTSYIVAPMVGASELPFRLLCRKYGASLAYTPMISSDRFAVDEEYRKVEFQCTPEDRPVVAHFSANNPETFLAAARHVEGQCDAIDLNLGCPQRVAHSGHFGSFLLDEVDRPLVLAMVRKLSSNLSIPMFVKIRLLDTVPDTIRLCTQLAEAGAALITIHGRYRVNLVGRTGAGARDGAAHLDQIRDVKAALLAKGISIPIIANGNVITWEDVTANRELTQTEGVMSAEGLLDDPALFFPALRERGQREGQCACGSDDSIVAGDAEGTSKKKNKKRKRCTCSLGTAPTEKPSKLTLAKEYLDLVDKHPAKMKTVIFHCRRMCREELNRYQLMDDCLAATCVAEVRAVIEQAEGYLSRGDFVFDAHKEKRAKEAIERRKREEGKRKAFEERMMRKAKREGKDLDFYLQRGAEPPSAEDLLELKQMTKEEAFAVWRSRFGQNCFAYHFESGGCTRERTCAFLHVDVSYTEATAFG